MPHFRQPARIKLISNSALCAASGAFPAKARNAVSASLSFGAPRSISSVMPVRPMISGVSRRSGSTKVWKVSTISPFLSRTAPISVMASCVTLRPVVSMSKQTISSEKPMS